MKAIARLLRAYLTLGIIVGPLPNTITDGQAVDVVPVMANFNWLLSQVNANAPSTSDMNTAIATAVSAIAGTVSAYTPTLTFVSQTGTTTYNSRSGFYTTIGKLVLCCGSISTSGIGASGLQTLISLPVPVTASKMPSPVAPSFVIQSFLFTMPAGTQYLIGSPNVGASNLTVFANKSGATSLQVAWADCTASMGFNFGGFYFTD